jgi:hypothetical protein
MFCLWLLSYDENMAESLRWTDPLDASITVHSRSNPKKGLVRELVCLLRNSEKTRVVTTCTWLLPPLMHLYLFLHLKFGYIFTTGRRSRADCRMLHGASFCVFCVPCGPYLQVRIGLLCLRNLVGHGSLNQQMLDVGALRAVQAILGRVWPDSDIHSDATYIAETLEKDIKEMTSWALYRGDVLSRSLSWKHPCHSDASFWRNNAKYFEADGCSTLKALIGLIEEQLEGPVSIGDLYSTDVLAAACRDVAQIVVAHPRAHQMFGPGAKRCCLQAAGSRDESVRSKAPSPMPTSW